MTIEAAADDPSSSAVVAFWRAAGRTAWFERDAAFDAKIRARFEAAHHAASRGERSDWLGAPEGALALLLLLDQAPRNLYRGSAHSLATDPLARRVAEAGLTAGFDRSVDPALRIFFYLPFEHSESLADQDRSLSLFEAHDREMDDEDSRDALQWARHHRDLIARFGRFPHRNAMLGRAPTAEEETFLAEGGFAG